MNRICTNKPIWLILGLVSVMILVFSGCKDDTTSPESLPPVISLNPSPTDGAVDVSTLPALSWQCVDPEGEQIVFDVYLSSDSSNLEKVSQGQSSSSYSPDTLEFETNYYWRIAAIDESDNLTEGPIWQFTTVVEPNSAPVAPSNPSPSDDSTGVPPLPTLSWQCSDPDNDPIVYDVYFGTVVNNLGLVSQNQTTASYSPGTLEYETSYFWKVTAKDNHNNEVTSNIWEFKTINTPNYPPNAPSNPTPVNEAVDISLALTLSWSCSDPENDPLTYDVYFGTDSANLERVSQGQSASEYEIGALNYETTYYWKVTANDDHGNQAESDTWGFTTEQELQYVQIQWCVVPAGEFTHGEFDQPMTIEYDYEIMKYEVTNWQYLQYLNEALNNGEIAVRYGEWVEGWWDGVNDIYGPGYYIILEHIDDGNEIDWDGEKFVIEEGREDFPVCNINWIGGTLFAEHYGWRLPTDLEWEKAARGNTGWDYSFADEFDQTRANYLDSGDPYENESYCQSTPVGYYNGENHDGFQTTDSPSPYGAYDMTCNSWEYIDYWQGIDLIHLAGFSFAHNDDIGLYGIKVWYFEIFTLEGTATNLGFRCVKDR